MVEQEESKRQTWWEHLGKTLTTDELFHDTEVQANRLGTIILLCSGAILVLILILTATGVFPLSRESIFPPAITALVETMVLLLVCRIVKNDAWWLKYLLMLGLVIIYARLDSMLTHKVAILMVLPVVFSSRYFSLRLTTVTALLTSIVFLASATWGATHGMINLNIVTMPEGVNIVTTGGFLGQAVIDAGVSDQMLIDNTLLYDYLPRWLMMLVASIISANIAHCGRDMVITQHKRDVEVAGIASELNLASRIQASMLPSVFPAFPDRTDFDIYASMDPAKEVGGDFYDFFLVDDDHLCLVIADVSDKGVPAALFMMASMIILSNNAKRGASPAQVLEAANESICSGNREDMFVTVWMGILELSTGKLVASNAGHEYPVLKRPNGSFELLKDEHGFVVGGMAGMPYMEYTLDLEPGSKIFAYTDGLPEATTADGEQFGTQRMVDALNEVAEAAPDAILKSMQSTVNEFVGDAEQFDDLTMLCMEYKGAS